MDALRADMIWILAACAPVETPAPPPPVDTTARPRPPSWVDPRVKEAHQRLQATPGGALLWEALEAHGGLAPFLEKGTLAFDFDYAPVGKPDKRRYSRSRVDIWARNAVQKELGDGADAQLGWNGTEAWIVPSKESFPSDARFWATTPFYFVALPWVLADPGAVPVSIEPVVIPGTGIDAPLPSVKVSFEAGTGDAPDDYYILHLHPDTKRIAAIRYIVSFPAFFKDGGHNPETLQIWSEPKEIDGLVISGRYEAFAWNEGTPGPLKTEVTIDNVVFGEPIPLSDFDKPAE